MPFLAAADKAMSQSAPRTARPAGGDGFDFLHGDWDVRHRKLARRLAGSSDWRAFDGTCLCRPLLGGLGNIEEHALDDPIGAHQAVGMRLFDRETRTWSIWWADPRVSMLSLDPPMQGGFDGGDGLFLSASMFAGRPIITRFRWTGTGAGTPRWEQAFSADGGATWEVNWIMNFRRRG